MMKTKRGSLMVGFILGIFVVGLGFASYDYISKVVNPNSHYQLADSRGGRLTAAMRDNVVKAIEDLDKRMLYREENGVTTGKLDQTLYALMGGYVSAGGGEVVYSKSDGKSSGKDIYGSTHDFTKGTAGSATMDSLPQEINDIISTGRAAIYTGRNIATAVDELHYVRTESDGTIVKAREDGTLVRYRPNGRIEITPPSNTTGGKNGNVVVNYKAIGDGGVVRDGIIGDEVEIVDEYVETVQPVKPRYKFR